jgi:6,7-dimethyl-8-ribityllumazine synthase
MSDRPEDAEDWPLRDWSQRLRPPAGAEPAPEAEILYEDLADDEEGELVPGIDEDIAPDEEGQPAEVEVLDEAAPEYPVDPEPQPESEPEPQVEPVAAPLPADQHAEGEFRVPDGYAILEGEPTGQRRSVAIVVSRFNAEITNRLLDSALAELDQAGVAQQAVLVMPVPGAFELPIAAMALAKTRRYSCVIALGCVIRGETPHFDFVASEAASGLQLAGIETGVPVSFGLLTTDTAEQAEARVGKGAEAARTALEMADAFAQLRTTLAAARGQ